MARSENNTDTVTASDLRELFDTPAGQAAFLEALESRLVRHALDAGAEEMLKRYLLRYVLPVLTVIVAVLAFFGWEVRRTVVNAMASVEQNRSAIAAEVERAKTQVKEATSQVDDVRSLQNGARAELKYLTEERSRLGAQFGRELGRIEQQHTDIDSRKRFIDQQAESVSLAATHVDARLAAAAKQLETAAGFVKNIETSATSAQSTASKAERLAVTAQELLERTQRDADAAFTAASGVQGDAEIIREYAATVRSLQNITERLLRAGILETVVMRSNRQASVKVLDLSAPTSKELVIHFKTPNIKKTGFKLSYTVGNQTYSEQLPPYDRLPYVFTIRGCNEQYQAIVDFIYSENNVPDFVSFRVRPRPI